MTRPRNPLPLLLASLLGATPLAAQGVGAGTGGVVALRQAERMLGHTKRVLLIAAHPDDEDTELLTLMVRGEGAEAAYLSLTRGEGGQNLIGAELGEDLGLLRSEELLAARRLDGARQYFTRAYDFGFSKRLEEALAFWPRDSLLKDAVRIVRRFRPQIIVSQFSGTPRDGHGQHQAAGWVAQEVFRLAGDPARFPELEREEGLRPWTPTKLFRSARFDTTTGPVVVLQGGVLDPELGQSYRQVAMRGRSLHRSQDMGVLQDVGPSAVRLQLMEDRGGTGAGFWSGIDTSAAGGDDGFEAEDARRHGAEAAANRAGLVFDAMSSTGRLLGGQRFEVRLVAWNGGARAATVGFEASVPRGWTIARSGCPAQAVILAAGAVRTCAVEVVVPEDAPLTTPYFLRQARDGAFYRWAGPPAVRGEPFEPLLVTGRFRFGGEREPIRLVEREVVHRYRDQVLGEIRRPLVVVPRVAVTLAPDIVVWPLGLRPPLPVTLTLQHTGRDSTRGEASLELPRGWPAVRSQPFLLTRDEERETLRFALRPPTSLAPGAYEVRAVVRDAAGRRYDAGMVTVEYPHIRPRTVARPAVTRVVVAPIALPALRRIGYVRGAADRVPEALLALGLPVELLDARALERGDFSRYDAVVIGSRAYEVEPALLENNAALLQYAVRGGIVIVQYQQQPYFRGRFAPRPLSLAATLDTGDAPPFRQAPPRVTDETAPVRLLDPGSPLFRLPNRIGPGDWEGWVQERGLYFAGGWDPAFQPALEMADPGEQPQRGGLLILPYGRGTYVYTGLSFFRQLPAGVPGALRLFLNLLSHRASAPSAAPSR
ncbi:MAG: PIG-L family deacetylase [Gemmatimonadales bacterium]